MDKNKVDVISFTKKIPKGTKNLILSERIKDNGTVIAVNVRFYPGQQLSLQVRPYIEPKGTKGIVDLLTYPDGTEQFLFGDDDRRSFTNGLAVKYDDYVKVMVTNTSDTYDYTLVCDVTVAYHGGGQ